MGLNLARMKKDEIVWMANHKCKKHSVSYIQHPNCFILENPDKQNVGIIDIETTQLKANWGIVLCVSILDLNSEKNFVRIITRKELFSEGLDKALLRETIAEMRKYDRLIGYYASNMRFDIPFLRSRAVYHDLDFPGFGEIVMEDLYPSIRYKFRLSNNRLETACRFLLHGTTKTHWMESQWLRAIQGNQKALDYIKAHCIEDTKETRRLYGKVFPFSRRNNASL